MALGQGHSPASTRNPDKSSSINSSNSPGRKKKFDIDSLSFSGLERQVRIAERPLLLSLPLLCGFAGACGGGVYERVYMYGVWYAYCCLCNLLVLYFEYTKRSWFVPDYVQKL